jgi:ATP-dependent Clp protease ATP-binding subunit ClpC
VTVLGYNLELTDAAKAFIAERGYDSKFGARPLQRAIQKYLEDPLAEELLNAEIKQGDTVVVDIDSTDTEKLKTLVKKAVTEEKVDG